MAKVTKGDLSTHQKKIFNSSNKAAPKAVNNEVTEKKLQETLRELEFAKFLDIAKKN
jgi:hypothetical protein